MIKPHTGYIDFKTKKTDWHDLITDFIIEILSFAVKWLLLIIGFLIFFHAYANSYIITTGQMICPLLK